LTNLATIIQNLDLSQGISNRLDVKLQAIQTAIASAKNNDRPTACNQMNAFDQYVLAQTVKGLTAAQAAQPLNASSNIKAALGFVKIRLRRFTQRWWKKLEAFSTPPAQPHPAPLSRCGDHRGR
jgi:hypothetical protein